MLGLRIIVIAGVVLGSAGAARAGYCDDEGVRLTVAEIETYAKRPRANGPSFDRICMEVVATKPKLVARVVAACTEIIAREPKHKDCVEWSVKLGATKLGDVELFDKVGKLFPLDPFRYYGTAVELYAKLGDPRALPLIRAMWTKSAGDRRAARKTFRDEWRHWRRTAIRAFAAFGGSDERAFLAAQAASEKDAGLVKAMQQAIGAIDKRMAL